MPIQAHFYHKTIRRLVVMFATLFNGYKIDKGDGTFINVPLAWSSKQKWFLKIKQDLDEKNLQSITLPRMGFVISSIGYDFARKVSSLNKVSAKHPDSNMLYRIHEPVPYNIDFDLFIVTRTVDEGLQLLEQIIPFFTPSFNVTIKELDTINVTRDIPIKLNSVTPDLKTEGSFDGDDVKFWDLSFTMEANIYKNIESQGIIKKVIVDAYPSSDVDSESYKDRYRAEVDPNTAYIDDEYSILESIGLVSPDTPKLL